ncbi:MAG: glycosyltransferase family 39 protein [Geminocystis sp.]|nr:glycosyltransferase family 39 protein [Geminocystis sp.]HIK36699.1 glycosyltransferase family 39 protein [Geminocystis sp. M7585_C2015_104]MCS7146778.1 glycosyltransferase family 39 protein [Geminocystis sp.]MCX8077072.1 glycosyltransferase family 39 protein [Geminocystis sp.]MDW8115604.1 glycosyltransferase family 39 protein [Geminocystis sp.]
MRKSEAYSPSAAVVTIIGVGLMIRVVIALFLYPGYDEAYYYVYSQNLDWSYFDHPVMVALTTGLGVWLTGMVNQFTIRIGSLILYTGSLYLLYLTGKKLFGCQSGLFSLVIASCIPIFMIGFGVLTLPDAPLIFFWSLTLYWCSLEFFREFSCYQPSYRLVIISLLVGLACLSKYHGFLLGLGLVGFCISNPPYRKVFLSSWLWWAIAVFLIILLPLLYWNWQHDWVSFGFQLSKRFQSTDVATKLASEVTLNPLNVLLNVLLTALVASGYLFPSFGLPLFWVTAKSSYYQFQCRQTPNYPYRLILWVSLPVSLGFILLGGLTQILPTWPMPGFWGLTVILGDYSAKWHQSNPVMVRRWLYFSGGVILTIFAIILLHLNLGLLQKPNKIPFIDGIIPPAADPSTQLVDTSQLSRLLALSPEFCEGLDSSDFVFTNRFYLGGYVGMSIASLNQVEEKPLVCLGEDCRGFNYWYPLEKLLGKNGIFITERLGESESSALPEEKYFDRWRKIAEIALKRGGETTRIFEVYQGENLKKIPQLQEK